MPVTGHWHLRARVADYLELRSQEIDRAEPAVVVLEAARAVTEWKRLEPPAIGHRRPLLHEFFGRTRTCLAIMDADAGRATALCWIGPHGEIGPGVAASAQELVPVVLQALDRVGQAREPESFGVFCASDSLVVASPPPQPRLPRLVAELGDVERPAAGARPLPAHPAPTPPVAGRR